MSEEILSITERLKKIEQANKDFETTKEVKSFKLPFGINMNKGKLRKDSCIVEVIKTNGSTDLKILPIEDNCIRIGDKYYSAEASHVLRYKRLPKIIICEWNMLPLSPASDGYNDGVFNPDANYRKASKDGAITSAQKYILTKMKLDVIKPSMNFNMKTVLILGAVGIGGYFLLSSMGLV